MCSPDSNTKSLAICEIELMNGDYEYYSVKKQTGSKVYKSKKWNSFGEIVFLFPSVNFCFKSWTDVQMSVSKFGKVFYGEQSANPAQDILSHLIEFLSYFKTLFVKSPQMTRTVQIQYQYYTGDHNKKAFVFIGNVEDKLL